jgi:hypothetical protein
MDQYAVSALHMMSLESSYECSDQQSKLTGIECTRGILSVYENWSQVVILVGAIEAKGQ